MKLRITILFMFFISISSLADEQQYPPKHWWSESQNVQDIEDLNEKDIARVKIKFAKVTVACGATKETVLRGKRITPLPCDNSQEAQKKRAKEFLENVLPVRLSTDVDWIELKSLFLEGDKIHSYAAPPLSGGYGYILVRNGAVIKVYEQGQQ